MYLRFFITKFTFLMSLFNIELCVSTRNTKLRNFRVILNTGFNSSTSLVDTVVVSTELKCAHLCLGRKHCCCASFDEINHACFLNPCCFAERTVLSNTVLIIPDKSVTSSPRDCAELPLESASGVYTITPSSQSSFEVYCDMTTACGGWTVLQRRIDGSVAFNRTWEEYENGFGSKTSEYWIGNKQIHQITKAKQYTVRFDLEDLNGNKAYATYSEFLVDDGNSNYNLTISGYSGTAGNALNNHNLNGMMFSTIDRDNDNHSGIACANHYDYGYAGWWHNACTNGNINAVYNMSNSCQWGSIYWHEWKGLCFLKTTEMKVRAD